MDGTDATTTDICVHHWVLGAPDDEVVRGRCKRCGSEREYPASVEAMRPDRFDEAAAIGATVKLLPDFAPAGALSGLGSGW